MRITTNEKLKRTISHPFPFPSLGEKRRERVKGEKGTTGLSRPCVNPRCTGINSKREES